MVRVVDRRNYSNNHQNNRILPAHQYYFQECSAALQGVLFGRKRQQQQQQKGQRRQLLLIRIVVCVSIVLIFVLLALKQQKDQQDQQQQWYMSVIDLSTYNVVRNLSLSTTATTANHTPIHYIIDTVNDDAEHLQDTPSSVLLSSVSSSSVSSPAAIPTTIQTSTNNNKIDNDDDTEYNIATTTTTTTTTTATRTTSTTTITTRTTTTNCDQMTNSRDIIDCLIAKARNNNNKYMTRAFYTDPTCQSITTWEQVQYCLMGRYDYNNKNSHNDNTVPATSTKLSSTPQSQQQRKRICEIHILGERNSGTKFVTQFLQQCFTNTTNGYSIRVHRDFLRSKHFFQPIPQPIYDYSTSLIVVVVRDPAEWMAAMVQYPYHSPNHIFGFQNGKVIPLSWQEFVNHTWIPAQRSYADRKELITQKDKDNAICTQQFRYHQVQPCKITEDALVRSPWNIPSKKIRGFYPVYEQRHFQNRNTTTKSTKSRSYDHLLQLRADKMINFVFQMSLLVHIGGFLVVRYEDILRHGNEFVLQQMTSILLQNQPIATSSSSTTTTTATATATATATGITVTNPMRNNSTPLVFPRRLPSKCSVIPPQPHRIGKRYIQPGFVQWINNNIDIDTERLIGYR